MDKYVANIADQDMRLGEKHDTSINVDMVNLGNSDELTRLFQDAYLEVKTKGWKPMSYL